MVHTGVIDKNYKKKIAMILSVPVSWALKKRQKKIAQILVLPYIKPKTQGKKRQGGFGNTNKIITLTSVLKKNRPLLNLKIQ